MFSIHRLSIIFVDSLLEEHDDKKDYKEIYEYSMEIFLSAVINILIIIILSTILRIQSDVSWYCLFFLPYRFLFGGAHAKTHARCILTFIVCMLTSIFIARNIQGVSFLLIAEILLITISYITNCYYAKMKCISKNIVSFIVPVTLLLFVNLVLHSDAKGVCATLGTVTQAVSFVIKNKG